MGKDIEKRKEAIDALASAVAEEASDFAYTQAYDYYENASDEELTERLEEYGIDIEL